MSTAYSDSRVAPAILPGVATKYQGLAVRAGYYLLILIACVSPWGDLLRIEEAHVFFRRGLATVFGVAVILIALLSTRFFSAIVARPRVLFFGAFVLLGIVASFLQSVPFVQSVQSGIDRGGYWMLMIAVLSLGLNLDQARLIVRIFAVSTAVVCVISIIDYYHIVDVPRFNEGYTEFLLDRGTAGETLGRALFGPFRSRAVFGPYIALAWGVPLMELIYGKLKNPLYTALWASVLLVLTFAIVLNYTRALYLTVAFVGLYTIYMSGLRKSLRLLLLIVPLLIGFFVVAQAKFPHEMQVFTHRLASLSPDKFMQEGGHFRVGTLQTTLTDLTHHPLGMGFGFVEYAQFRIVAHSIFVEHLRPAGFLGLILVGFFFWPLLKTIVKRSVPPTVSVLSAALLGTLAYGLAHSTHSMLVGWIVIGLLYDFSGKTDQGLPEPLPVVSPATRARRRRPRSNGSQ